MARPTPLLLAFLVPALSGCFIHTLRHNVVVDGVELEEKHTETIEISSWDAAGLEIRCWGGDVEVEATSGPNRIVLTLHELTPGDARAVYEGGRLGAHTASGAPYAVGDVHVFTNAPLPSLDVDTGMGDVRLTGIAVTGKLRLDTGMGDIDLRDVSSGAHASASSGMGDIGLRASSFGTLTASSGMGGIHLSGVEAREAGLDSDMGDVTIRDSQLAKVQASTGLGDVECRDSRIGEHDFDTGLGSVRTR